MKIEQIYTGCLSQGAYYIESNGEVAIIDPLRETQQYIDKAISEKATIKYVFETHFHADFVSGHVDLAKKTNSTIIFGPGASTQYEAYIAKDNEEFKVGKVIIKVLHTPGHTLESSTYLLIDENGNNHAIFTGDTLFLGDVGRPDLAIKSDLNKEDLAAMLYDSLRTKIMCLDDDVIVYPAHGAGSACGKNLSKETIGTIGGQKKSNYALRTDMTKEEFIKELLDGMSSPPQYFAKNAMLNKMGYNSFDEVLEAGDVALNLNEFEQLTMQKNVLILDVRSPSEYVTSHIPNSIFIGLNGAFAPWVGALIIDLKQPILLIVPEGKSKEAITRLSRVGYDNTLGYLSGGIKKWKTAGKPIETMTSISAKELAKKNKLETLSILDVRKDGEFKSSHIKNVQHFSLDLINKQLHDISPNNTYYIHCAGGYRSVIAASILKANGFKNIVDIAGGFNALKETDMPLTDLICPTIK
ncbi:MBL fold metallo-hydrolase [Flavobacteriaceae bacterium]|nr:MBL fold metallo-hydrolase [Flavobacteriaceae bacterium]